MPAGFWPFPWLSLYRSQLRWPTWIRVLNAFLCQCSCKTVALLNFCWTGDCTGHGSYVEQLLLNISQLKKKRQTFWPVSTFTQQAKAKWKLRTIVLITCVLAVLGERKRLLIPVGYKGK